MVKQKKETAIQKAAVDWMRVNGIECWRMPLGPVIHSFGNKQVWKKNPIKGFPDVAGILTKTHRGVLFAIEFKSESGRSSPEQLEWHERLARAGAKVAVVKSLSDLELVMIKWGEYKPQGLVFCGDREK